MKRLIMVYNADSGYFNAVADAMHKFFSPATYACNLCAITFGAVAMKTEWQDFIGHLELPVEFLHRDEFLALHEDVRVPLPTILLQDSDNPPAVLVDAAAIGDAKTVDDLKKLIQIGLDA